MPPACSGLVLDEQKKSGQDLTSQVGHGAKKRAVVSEKPRSAPRSEIRDPRYEDSLPRLKLKFDPPFEACYAVHFRVIEIDMK